MLRHAYGIRLVAFASAVSPAYGLLATAQAQLVIYVDDDAPLGGDGTTWNTAFRYLQDALAAAEPGDEIHVAHGIYKPDQCQAGHVLPGDRRATFRLPPSVPLYGGYRGCPQTGCTDVSPHHRDVVRYPSILSGDLASDDHSPRLNIDDNSYHIVDASATDERTVLSGFTISGGNANGNYPHNRGGGMYNELGSPTLHFCSFNENNASHEGGAMYNGYYSSPSLAGCAFTQNSAQRGGALFNDSYSSPTMNDSTFVANSAGAAGGAIYNFYSSPSLLHCLFEDNSAESAGGAVYNWSSSPILGRCTVRSNFGGDGGAIYNSRSDTIVTDSLFSGNSAALVNYLSMSVLTNCTLVHNYGPTIRHDGLILPSTTVLNGCILWGDGAGSTEDMQLYPLNSGFVVNYTYIKGWTGTLHGVGNIGGDPLFVDADGPDDVAGTQDDNPRLLFGSPAVDAGDPTVQPQLSRRDLDGHARLLCSRVDMGAFETGFGDYDCSGDLGLVDFRAWHGCMKGPGATSPDGVCGAFDTEFDDDIDLCDYAKFQTAFAGP